MDFGIGFKYMIIRYLDPWGNDIKALNSGIGRGFSCSAQRLYGVSQGTTEKFRNDAANCGNMELLPSN